MQSTRDAVTTPRRAVSESVSLIRQSLGSVAIAEPKYPNYRSTRLVLSRLDWDDADVAVLGAIVAADLSSRVELRPRLFDHQLRHTMDMGFRSHPGCYARIELLIVGPIVAFTEYTAASNTVDTLA